MNRTIKFRAKTTANGHWVYGFYCRHDYGAHYQDKKLIKAACTMHDIWTDNGWVAVEEESVAQFTGLTDRNGKEIYEGDILSFQDNDGNVDYEKVIFHDGCFKVDDGWQTTTFNRIDTHERVIIGNVFDNFDLIN